MSQPKAVHPRNRLQKDVKASKFFALTKQKDERAIALNCVFSDGTQKAFMYAYMSSYNFDPSIGIEIISTDGSITIKGRNLQPIYDGLLRHKIRWVKQFLNEIEDDTPEDECFVNFIDFQHN